MPSQIQGGETFVDGQACNASRLNNHVNGGIILPGAVSEQPTTSPAGSDRALLYDASGGVLISPTIDTILNLQLKDAAAGTASMRTLGTGATQAAQGSLVGYLASGNVWTGTNNRFRHISGTIGVTIAANAGAGTGATAVLATGSTDLFGRITLTPAGTPTASSSQCTVTFATAYSGSNGPFVTVTAYGPNALAAQQGTKVVRVGNETVNGFDLISGSTPLVAGTSYVFDYHVFNAGA